MGTYYPLQYFPFLGSHNHTVESPVSEDYNCIAWAAGLDDCQVWPGVEGFDWPADLPQDESIDSFVAYFESIGYELCSGPALERGYEKIAIFADDTGPTHASRQLPNGKWSSKMGRYGVDIEHDGLACIEGSQYGEARLFLRRPAVNQGATG